MRVAEIVPVTIIVDGGDPRTTELEIGQAVNATYRFALGDTFGLKITARPSVLEN